MEESREYKPKEYYYMALMHKNDSLVFDSNRYTKINKWAELLTHAWWREKRKYKVETNNEYKVVRVTRIN